MYKFKTLYSTEVSEVTAIHDLKKQLGSFEAKALMFFVTSNLNSELINSEFKKVFEGINVFGCTTSGEIVTGRMLDNSIVAMAFGEDVIGDIKIEVITNLKSNENGVKAAFDSFEDYFGKPTQELNTEEYVGFVFIDGVSGMEEEVNDEIGNLTNITFIGGSAGDDLKFKATSVFANGEVHTNAALLALIKSKIHFSVLKTQSFDPTDKILKVTKCDEVSRTVIEFNNKPATVAYAEALGVAVSDLSQSLFKNPVGLMFNGEPFVRSPRLIDGDHIIFYCSVKEGTELSLLRSTDIIHDTKEDLKKKEHELGHISGIVNFNCILRTLDLKQQNLTQEYGDLFNEVPTVGFSTYGESYIGHINQTATMLVFGE